MAGVVMHNRCDLRSSAHVQCTYTLYEAVEGLLRLASFGLGCRGRRNSSKQGNAGTGGVDPWPCREHVIEALWNRRKQVLGLSTGGRPSNWMLAELVFQDP